MSSLVQAAPAPAPSAGARLFQSRCSLCHALDGGSDGQGPSLAGVVGRKAGSTDFDYSRALKEAGFVWDGDRLDRFLTEPSAAVPGTAGRAA